MKVNFNLFKNPYKEAENQPDYNMTTYDKENNKSTRVGACWIKKSSRGAYLSCQYNDEPYQSDVDKQMDNLTKPEYPKEEIKPDDIPF